MAERKKTHFGRAGEYFAMSELLLRGWNVAVPVVDVGDDMFVIEDAEKKTYRLQVKTGSATYRTDKKQKTYLECTFPLSREALRAPFDIELIYMLIVRDSKASRWRFLVIPRSHLDIVNVERMSKAAAPGTKKKRGQPLKADDKAKSDQLNLVVSINEDSAEAWDAKLDEFLDRWPDELPVVKDGPGSVASSAVSDGVPRRSQRREK